MLVCFNLLYLLFVEELHPNHFLEFCNSITCICFPGSQEGTGPKPSSQTSLKVSHPLCLRVWITFCLLSHRTHFLSFILWSFVCPWRRKGLREKRTLTWPQKVISQIRRRDEKVWSERPRTYNKVTNSGTATKSWKQCCQRNTMRTPGHSTRL